jgi:hypothetical protein
MKSLDPAGMGERRQTVAILASMAILVFAAVALGNVAPKLAGIAWVGFPLVCAVMWRADGVRFREIGTWCIPLIGLAVLAQFLPLRLGDVVGGAVIFCSLLLSVVPPVGKKWIIAVRHLPGMKLSARQEYAGQLLEIHDAISVGMNDFVRDEDGPRLQRRVHELLARARDVRTDDSIPNEPLALLVRYLESLESASVDPMDQPPGTFETLGEQLVAFRASFERLIRT